jgi:energy-coupling factor transporter ATP-binding protein EcfA2
MITKVTIQNFKRFKDPTEFVLRPDGVTFLAGGNNSGKSTLLQALAVWEFARSVIEINRGKGALMRVGQGVGVSAEEFSPIALPNLKHLFSDLHTIATRGRDGYVLRIKCDWHTDSSPPVDRYLEIGLSMSNDRLFLKRTGSKLTGGEIVPRLAYLPPFAGIGAREERMSPAARKRWIGRGLAGAVLRNLLYDFWQHNHEARQRAQDLKGNLPSTALAKLRATDSWERLLKVLEEVFKTGLTVKHFNEQYHTSVEVSVWQGQLVKKYFRKRPASPAKDLMVEGSGFLQWLSVYALALNPEIDVLLLDEPDAHLHPELQGYLVQKLGELARENRKQVLLATHSTTILSENRLDQIFRIEDRKYLDDERGRVALFIGLGSQYAPRLDQLKRSKRLFLHDGPSDLEILQRWARTLGLVWPDNVVCWKYTKDRFAREVLFEELRTEIHGIRAISLQDRDDYPFAETKADLTFDSLPLFSKGLGLRRWRRRNIENYLLHPASIAKASGKTERDVRSLLCDPHGLSIPADFTCSDCVQTLANTDGKEILTKHARSIKAEFGVDYRQIAEAMTRDEIPEDAKTLLQQLIEMCRS